MRTTLNQTKLVISAVLLIMAVICSVGFTGEMPKGIYMGPTWMYWWYGWGSASYEPFNADQNQAWPDNDLFYPDVRSMGVNFTVTGHLWEMYEDIENDHGLDHVQVLDTLNLFTMPNAVIVIDGNDTLDDGFSALNAMTTVDVADEIWDEGGFDWNDEPVDRDYFPFTMNTTGGVCSAWEPVADTLWFYSDADDHNEGFIIEPQAIFKHLHHYGYPYTFEIELMIDDQPGQSTDVLRFTVYDPSLGVSDSTSFIVETGDFNDEDVWQDFCFNVDPLSAKGNTKISLYWFDIATISVRTFRMYDYYHGKLYIETNDTTHFWDACQEEFEELEDYFQAGNLWGWLVDEPWRATWSNFGLFRERVDDWINNNELRVTAVSSGLAEDYIVPYLETTQVPELIYDAYTIGWAQNSKSEGDSTIQYAWNRLIKNSIHGDYDYFYNGGLRAAIEKSQEKDKDLWFCMQTSGALKKKDDGTWRAEGLRDPTREEIRCEGFLGLTYGAKGFVYYHYSPIYHYGYRNPTGIDLPEWNGAIGRGLVDFWPDYTDTTETELVDSADFVDAINDLGWLHPNEKWYAVRDFNHTLDSLENLVTNLKWITAGCAEYADNNTISYVTIDSTCDTLDNRDDSLFVEVGIFKGINTPGDTFRVDNDVIRGFSGDAISIVNRRVNADTTGGVIDDIRIIYGKICWPYYGPPMSILDTRSLMVYDPPKFEITLGPGDGTFVLPIHQTTSNVGSDTTWGTPDTSGKQCPVYIDEDVIVSSGATLTIHPGTSIIFGSDCSLVVNGNLKAVGKVDSVISFISIGEDHQGQIKLKGSATDSIEYCSLIQLERGLKITKSSGEKVWIENSAFSDNAYEGLYATGGDVAVRNCLFANNGADGAYVYNSTVTIENTSFNRNEKNGLYLYSVNASSQIKNCDFNLNGDGGTSSTDAGVRFYNCSPKMEKSTANLGAKYGLYGANGAYPVMWNATTAANTIEDNADHETFWDLSYPSLSYGHNNFDTEDDTIIYIKDQNLSSFDASGNYWGGGPPNTAGPVSFYCTNPSCSFTYDYWDSSPQTRVPEDRQLDAKFKLDPEGQIADDEEDAHELLVRAVGLEEERALDAMDDYRQIISRYGATSAAPIAVERLLWLTRSHYRNAERMDRLDNAGRYFANIADTSRSRGLAWKAHRASLWALTAQHRYDEAIRGFEAIIQNPDNLADSIFAVIDVGTIHLEAQEWAERDSLDRAQSIFGSVQELAPVDFPTHRKHTDELLAMLNNPYAFNSRPSIPTEYFLDQNYPNPFNSTTRISYGLPEASPVKICIYDVMGRKVTTLIDEQLQAGYYSAFWNGKTVSGVPIASGLYFYRIEAEGFVKVKKMTMIK